MRALVIFLVLLRPPFAADANGLIGTWKLVSWQVIVDNEPVHGELQIQHKTITKRLLQQLLTWDAANVKRCRKTSQTTV